MKALTIQFSDSLQQSITTLAEQEDHSVDQFLASATAEETAALMTLDYLRREAAPGKRGDFEGFLAAAPRREPAGTDRLPE